MNSPDDEYDYHDPGDAEVVSSTFRRAAKPHICDDCSRTIEKKQIYLDTFLLLCGSPAQHRRCQECVVLNEQPSTPSDDSLEIRYQKQNQERRNQCKNI